MKKTILILAACMVALTASASLLTDPPETPAQRAARETIASVQSTRTVLLGQLRDGVSRLWDSPDPQGALDLIVDQDGNAKAVEVVNLYETLVGFLQTILTQAGDTQGLDQLAEIVSKAPPLTKNADGSVTVLPLPTPSPTPE